MYNNREYVIVEGSARADSCPKELTSPVWGKIPESLDPWFLLVWILSLWMGCGRWGQGSRDLWCQPSNHARNCATTQTRPHSPDSPHSPRHPSTQTRRHPGTQAPRRPTSPVQPSPARSQRVGGGALRSLSPRLPEHGPHAISVPLRA